MYTFPFAFIGTVVIHEKQKLMTFSYHHFLTSIRLVSLDCIVFRIFEFLKCCFQASEMVLWVKVAAKPEDLSLMLRIHMAEGESNRSRFTVKSKYNFKKFNCLHCWLRFHFLKLLDKFSLGLGHNFQQPLK